MIEVTIPLRSQDEAILVLGPYDRYAKLLRQSLDIELSTRGGNLLIKGIDADVAEARRRIDHLLGKVRKGRVLSVEKVEGILLDATSVPNPPSGDKGSGGTSKTDSPARSSNSYGSNEKARAASVAGLRTRAVEPRSQNQRRYLEAMEKHSLVFGMGAAGTGKTFLAVAAALRAMRSGSVRRLIITRPVVEAGEHLGFLPGDFQAKLNPYMRPVHDALSSLMRFEDLAQLEETGIVEIAPLAYMRGRTLSDAFVILDEAQNTSPAQMKMFLTRLGEGSRMVVTGDPSQSDLPTGQRNGLTDAVHRLRGFEGISLVEFDARDIVRHPLVSQIVRAYEAPVPSDREDSTPQG
ncbi:MAG: phosphate starvation-inducible PhoH-like protein [Planctomycetota bacterium]